MKSYKNLAYVFLCVGIINLVFLLDTIVTHPENEFSLFSIATNKKTNIIYYGIIGGFLSFTGIYLLKNNTKKPIE